MATAETLTGAIITTDEEFRSVFRDESVKQTVDLVLDLAVPIPDVSEGHIEDLGKGLPDVLFLDVAEEPDLACQLAQHIVDAGAARRIIAAGPMQSPEFLLSAMQAGVAEYLTKPVSAEELVGAVARAQRSLGPREAKDEPQREGKLLAFFSPKGGGGATTIATNLSIQLHRLTQSPTVVADLDLELGEAALFLGLQPRYNIVDLANNMHRVDTGLLSSYIMPHESGVRLLAAPYQPQHASQVSDDQVSDVLSLLKRHYDYIIVDCPKALISRTYRIFDQADEIYMVFQMDVPTIQNLQRAQAVLNRFHHSGHPVRFIVNRYDPGNEITIGDLEHSLETEVFWTIANDYDSASYSMNTGKPLIMRPGSVCGRELEGLAAKIAGISDRPSGTRGRLFGKIFDGLRDRMSNSSSTPSPKSLAFPPAPAEGESR